VIGDGITLGLSLIMRITSASILALSLVLDSLGYLGFKDVSDSRDLTNPTGMVIHIHWTP